MYEEPPGAPPVSGIAIDSGIMSAAPGWGVLRAEALRLAAVEAALRRAVPGPAAVLCGAAPWEADLSLEAVLRAVLL